MNIAHLLPASARFPLKKPNGRYEWVLRLAKIQAKAGHQVTIYCGGGASDEEPSLEFKSSDYDFGNKTVNNLALMKKALLTKDHEIFHSHFDFLHHFAANSTTKPLVATQHWFPDSRTSKAAALNPSLNVTTVPVTEFMASENRNLGIDAASPIYHGIDLELFEPVANPRRKRLLSLGRITPHKGTLEAVKIAKAAGIGLDIVGKINDSDMPYWEKIKPLVDDSQIRYLGTKSHSELRPLYANALALLFPSPINEAFGQVTIEAQACGTPVITSATGTSRELVIDRVTGFICQSSDDYLKAIEDIDIIDPSNCRQHAEKYSLKGMVQAYDELYASLLSN